MLEEKQKTDILNWTETGFYFLFLEIAPVEDKMRKIDQDGLDMCSKGYLVCQLRKVMVS